jgi:hypothetical protein
VIRASEMYLCLEQGTNGADDRVHDTKTVRIRICSAGLAGRLDRVLAAEDGRKAGQEWTEARALFADATLVIMIMTRFAG